MPELQPINPLAMLGDADELDFRQLAEFNDGSIGIFRSGPGQSPWELHPEQDEILMVLEGAVIITVLYKDAAVDVPVSKGSMLVVPHGHWHRHTIEESLVELYVSPKVTEHSMAVDPRADD